MCVCTTFVVVTDCESCTWSISTKPGSMEACEYGLTLGTSFVARRLEVVAVARLLWISWFRGVFWVRRDLFRLFFLELTRPAASMRTSCLIPLSTSSGVRTWCHNKNSSVRLYVGVCSTVVIITDCESCTWPSSTNPGSLEAGEYHLWTNAWDVFHHTP